MRPFDFSSKILEVIKQSEKQEKMKEKCVIFIFMCIHVLLLIYCVLTCIFSIFSSPLSPLLSSSHPFWKFLDPCLYEVHFVSTVVLDGDWCNYIDLEHVAEHSPSTDVLQYLPHKYLKYHEYMYYIKKSFSYSSFVFSLVKFFEWVRNNKVYGIWQLKPEHQQI